MNPAWLSLLYDAARDVHKLFYGVFADDEPVEDEVDQPMENEVDQLAHIDYRLYQIEKLLRKQLSLMEGDD